MSGGGHIIIDDATIQTLSNPLVQGALPGEMQSCVRDVLAKASADWTYSDRCVLGHAYTWALCNL